VPGARIKYVAQLSHVREVSLFGAADLSYWAQRLRDEELVPEPVDDRAQVLVIAADGKFRGIRFREVSFSIAVRPPQGQAPGDASYLVHAFSSNRFFAFCERLFFSTPYYPADVRVSSAPPASIDVRQGADVLFTARMGDVAGRSPRQRGPGGWAGPVFLPRRRSKDHRGTLFHARIAGETAIYPFLPELDSIALRPSPHAEVFDALLASHFEAKEWHLRTDATHAKSKTYRARRVRLDGPVVHQPRHFESQF
jgi:hypothetical protein